MHHSPLHRACTISLIVMALSGLAASEAHACFGESYERFDVLRGGLESMSETAPSKPIVTGNISYGESSLEGLFKDISRSTDGYSTASITVESDPSARGGELCSIGYIIEHAGGDLPAFVELPEHPICPTKQGYMRLGSVTERPLMFFTPRSFSLRVTPIDKYGVRGESVEAHLWRAGKPWPVVIFGLFLFGVVWMRRRIKLVAKAA